VTLQQEINMEPKDSANIQRQMNLVENALARLIYVRLLQRLGVAAPLVYRDLTIPGWDLPAA
jgi:hypothetical protein